MNDNTRGDTTDDYDNTTHDDVAHLQDGRLRGSHIPASPVIGGSRNTMKFADISGTRGSKVSQSLMSTQLASADYSSKISMRIHELKKIKNSKYGK